jgi:RimJ/RimL family protein N-acetyltransferase
VDILDTKRLFLRHLRADDADFILELLNEPAFRRNIGDRDVRNSVDARRYMVAGPVASYKQFGFGLHLMALKETGVPIGICGLRKRESMQDLEIGFAWRDANPSLKAFADTHRGDSGLKAGATGGGFSGKYLR